MALVLDSTGGDVAAVRRFVSEDMALDPLMAQAQTPAVVQEQTDLLGLHFSRSHASTSAQSGAGMRAQWLAWCRLRAGR